MGHHPRSLQQRPGISRRRQLGHPRCMGVHTERRGAGVRPSSDLHANLCAVEVAEAGPTPTRNVRSTAGGYHPPPRVESEDQPEGPIAPNAHYNSVLPQHEFLLQRRPTAAPTIEGRIFSGRADPNRHPRRRWFSGMERVVCGQRLFPSAHALHKDRYHRRQRGRLPSMVWPVRIAYEDARCRAGVASTWDAGSSLCQILQKDRTSGRRGEIQGRIRQSQKL
mmetsp:Transcript_24345/g.70017  ORF Transcript_24345/g.70017 Transcript_24345/m.70017 type:complete len:222 (-) Transcript_24345:804-1469(-)